ncbi:recombination-associated protein RdgC [Pelomonas sp. P7]|uniref:Recombination-associated protein RdgC n=1 Tax=Pelomonas caseinilytica TaxID=2906763 RepID=A0ABS8XGD1_9BURK|nr:recombination-associated protein RdgC [Pelomonas sp. P7]MCE4539944.1 recombination-associated protein RdgC [Pelomonas sp. P7]
MFKNLITYRIGEGWQTDAAQLAEQLAKEPFLPCTPTQALAVGWAPPRGVEHAPLVEVIDGHWLLKLRREQRLLPSSVVQERVDELAEQIEEATGRKPGKKARKDLKEQATHELLPRAFTKSSATRVWIAPQQRLLFVDAGSSSRADEVVTLLIQASPGLSLQLVQTAESPAACMAAWLLDGVTPEGFQIERECELKGSDEQKPVVRYARHPLDIDEVRAHLTSGKMPTRLALSWNERVAFTLTEGFAIKKISFLDLAFEGRPEASGDEAFDADAALATGELGRLIPALIEGLGGEHDFAAGAAAPAAAPAALPAPVEEAISESPPW